MNAKELLQEAKKLLVERGWSRGTYARDKDGFKCEHTDPKATQFCTIGALWRVRFEHDLDSVVVIRAIDYLRKALGEKDSYWALIDYNDSRKKEEILALFDAAIERA